jgi:hypothetical protein
MTIPSTLNMLNARTTYYMDGSVKSIQLVAGCELDIYDTTLWPVRTVALACPRVDYIRLWPLPIEEMWVGDG